MRRASSLALALGLVTWSQAAGQTLHYEGGISLASGSYIFTERTTSWTFYNGLALSAGPLSLRGTLPVYVQSSALISGTSTGLLPTGGPYNGVVADSSAARKGRGQGGLGMGAQVVGSIQAAPGISQGDPVDVTASTSNGYEAALGDPSFNLSLAVLQNTHAAVTVSVGAKVPVTDTASFGTGEWDVGGSVAVSHRIGSSTLLGMDIGYWHLGDLPELDLRDPILGSVSVAHLSSSGWGGSVTLSGGRSVIEGFDPTYSVGFALTRITGRGAFGINASAGLTETTPDFTVGLTWRFGLLQSR
jgi:hypothetical protein